MDPQIVTQSLAGGALIGTAGVLFLLASGRILGISGITFGLLEKKPGDAAWRIVFLLGLLAGAAAARVILNDDRVRFGVDAATWLVALAGLIVGIGTKIGSGCTSGHGICGIGRLSPRSIVATVTFMLVGMATVFLVRHVLGGSP